MRRSQTLRALQHCWRTPNRPWWSRAVTSTPGTAPGEATVALFAAGRQYLAAVTVVGSHRVRSHGLLEGDVLLAEPERLIRWLAVTTGEGDGKLVRL